MFDINAQPKLTEIAHSACCFVFEHFRLKTYIDLYIDICNVVALYSNKRVL